jgi:hypothetical protein
MSTPTFKQFVSDIQKMVGSSAFLRVSTPSDSDTSWASVVSPSAQLFTKFPYFLGTDHEPFSISLETLASVSSVANAKTTLEMNDDTLTVTTGSRYKADLSVSPCTDSLIVAPTLEESSFSLDVSQDFLDLFRSTLPVLGIEKIHAAQADFRLFVKFGRKKIFIAVYSPMQVVCASLPNSLGAEGDFNVPYPVFLSLIKSLPKSGCSLKIGDDAILVEDESYTLLTLVAPMSPKDPPGELVMETSTNLLSNASDSVVFSKSELEVFLSSSKGVITDDTPVRFLPSDKGGLLLQASTASSQASFKLKVDKCSLDSPFALELKFLKNLLSKSGDTITLHVANGVLVMKSGSLGMITTTFADDASGSSTNEV